MGEALKTRTLARLYLAQGYPGRARKVVRGLLARTPDDADLLALLREIDEAARTAPEAGRDAGAEPDEDRADVVPEDEPGPARAPVPRQSPQEGPPPVQPPAQPETLSGKARDLGTALVDHLTAEAGRRLGRLLDRIRERRR